MITRAFEAAMASFVQCRSLLRKILLSAMQLYGFLQDWGIDSTLERFLVIIMQSKARKALLSLFQLLLYVKKQL